jgi:hypothetical protein
MKIPNANDIAETYAPWSTFSLPEHWSPAQALAVWELLQELADRVWERYDQQLLALIREEYGPADPHQPDLFDPDDPIPF